MADIDNLVSTSKPFGVFVPERHKPKRDDDVCRWLKRKRDEYPLANDRWDVVDVLLDDYRTRADYGLTLDSEGDGHGSL